MFDFRIQQESCSASKRNLSAWLSTAHFTRLLSFIQLRRLDGKDSRESKVNLNMKPALPSLRLRVSPSLRLSPARP